MQLYIESSVFC